MGPEKTSAPSTPVAAAPVSAVASGSASSMMAAGASSAPAASSMKPASSSGGDWHDRFSKTQRDMVRDRMHTVLLASGKARHGVDESSATPLFNKYEDHVYSTASSLHDYYEKIAEIMVEVKASSGAASSSASATTHGNSGSSSTTLLGSRSASGTSGTK